MARRSPSPRKFTKKDIAFGLMKNVNDETTPGFKTLQNIDPNAVANAVQSRPGMRMSLAMPTAEPAASSQVRFTTSGAGDHARTSTSDFSSTLGQVQFVFVPEKTGYLDTIRFNIIPNFTLGASSIIYPQLYEWDKFTNQPIGNPISSGLATDITAFPPNVGGIAVFVFRTQLGNINSAKPVVVAGKPYYVVLNLSPTIGNVLSATQRLEFNAEVASEDLFGVRYDPVPTQPIVWTVMQSCIPFTYEMLPATQTNILTDKINSLDMFKDKTYIATQVNPLNKTFGYGALSELASTGVTERIKPAMSPASPAISAVGDSYPAALYGAKVVEDVHTYGLFYGAALAGRATTADTNYLMFKRADTKNNILPVVTSVPTLTPPAGVAPYFVTATSLLPYAYPWQSAADELKLVRTGSYEFAFEFVDFTGYAYRATKDNNTIIRAVIGEAQTMSDGELYQKYFKKTDTAIIERGERIFSVVVTIPLPAGYTADDFAFVRVYIRKLAVATPVNRLGVGAVNQITAEETPDSSFSLWGEATLNTARTAWTKSTVASNPLVPTFLAVLETSSTILTIDERYTPRPVDFCMVKGHIIAAGDPEYPASIFPSRDYRTDFYIDDIHNVSLPVGDSYFTACTNFLDDGFVFSAHGTWRVRQVSTSAPYFQVQQVSSRLGCITTSKGIVQYGQTLLIPTAEGLMWFDGYNYRPADQTINNVFNTIPHKEQLISLGGTPTLSVGHIPAFEVSGVFDSTAKNILYVMPKEGANALRTVYALNVGIGQWSTYTLPVSPIGDIEFFFPNHKDGGVGFVTAGKIGQPARIYNLMEELGEDYPYDTGLNGYTIPTILEIQDINFGEQTSFQKLRLWGKGTIDVSIYLDREVDAVATYTDIVLDDIGEIGTELNLGWIGTYFRYKITVKDSDTFLLKSFELTYLNAGVKKFRSVADGTAAET